MADWMAAPEVRKNVLRCFAFNQRGRCEKRGAICISCVLLENFTQARSDRRRISQTFFQSGFHLIYVI